MASWKLQSITSRWSNSVSCGRTWKLIGGGPCQPWGRSLQGLCTAPEWGIRSKTSLTSHDVLGSHVLGRTTAVSLFASDLQQRRSQSTSPKKKESKSKIHVEWAPDLPLRLLDKYCEKDQICSTIVDIWQQQRQSRKVYQSKLSLLRWLSNEVFTDFNLTIIGSSASGFGFDDSDVDISMQFKTSLMPIDYDKKAVLKTIKHRISGEQGVRRVHFIPAIVPLLQFDYKRDTSMSKMKVELNLDNFVGILNTQLLFAYSRMDCRVAPLMLAAKRWASKMDIKDALRGTMSSYTLTLIVLYFLQTQGVVPVLHHIVPEFAEGRGFDKNRPFVLPAWKSGNTLTLGELFRELLVFYSTFDFENECICVRDGKTISKEEAMQQDPDFDLSNTRGNISNSKRWWNYMLVQEPFNSTNVARAVYQKQSLERIVSVFQRSLQVLDRPGGIKVLMVN